MKKVQVNLISAYVSFLLLFISKSILLNDETEPTTFVNTDNRSRFCR